jgi:O-acetyl-ADP-ribose deacetylase (regulator of RNase III)
MIHYVKGDLFLSPAKVLVNPVNTEGIMGKGIALKFKNNYHDMFVAYQNYCKEGLFTIGKLMLFKYPNKWILLFPTKESWKMPSKLAYIDIGLKRFINVYKDKKISSIAFPKLGCGNGGLDWEDVKPIMEKYLNNISINVFIYL